MVKNTIFQIKEAVYLLLLLFFLTGSSYCQNKKTFVSIKDKSLNNTLHINTGIALINSLKFQNYAETLLKSNVSYTYLLEIGYYRKIYKTLGVKLGAGFNKTPYNLNFSFNVEQNSGIAGKIYNNSQFNTTASFNVFLLLNKMVPINKKIIFELEGGIQFNTVDKYAFPIGIGYNYYDDVNNISLEFLRIDIYDKGACYSFKGNANFLYKINKRNTLIAGLTFNYSPFYIAEGTFCFNNLPWESYGTIKLGVNYVGLKVGYGFLL